MKPGRIVEWQRLSSTLAIFRLVAESGGLFPTFIAGQHRTPPRRLPADKEGERGK